MAQPNILWIMADELRADALACYGGAWSRVWTPNIDALAARGVLFENNFCNAPVCVPSRISMLTATPPEQNGVYSNEGSWPSYPLPLRLETFPELFARHGYRVASIGKSHHGPYYKPWPEDIHDGSSMHAFGLDVDATPFEPIVPRGIPSPVGGVFPEGRSFPPEAVTANALRWLDQASGQEPFLLRVSYLQPHTPVLPPARYRALYRARDWPGHDLPRGYGSAYEEAFAEIVGGRELSHAQMQQAQADYHALVTWLDAQVGMVLGKLRLLGLEENTIVVLNSDHGASLGENGLLSKVVFAPQSHRTPVIFSWPGQLPAGTRRSDLSQNMDLARTLCALAGIAPASRFGGRSLFEDPPPQAIYATIGSGAPGAKASVAANRGTWRNGKGWPRRSCVRTAQFRLDMNVRQDGAPVAIGEEDIFLADMTADPREQVNLAADLAYGVTVSELRTKLLLRAAEAIEPDYVPAFSAEESPEFLPPRIALSGGGQA
ncbi:sulfatase-like hydrolase/transferase [Chelativorans sp. J32]|uniref:sulfatase-like hydrolase/transferase n=1 Tax=Chelativorans sp. J32 TaxID=935840 RepID=UPI000480563B|nr:sulfatase-like hydrolase/transferase [Chelativorans sp. J32]